MVGQLMGDMFGVLRIHRIITCVLTFLYPLVVPPYPSMNRRGIRRPIS